MGNACYANSVIQVLLRLPSVSLWLHAHASRCEVRRQGPDSAATRCTACALWATRLQLGSSACPALVRYRATVDPRFARRCQHDAAEFLQLLLGTMRTQELQAGRAVDWVGVQSDLARATHGAASLSLSHAGASDKTKREQQT